MAEAIINPGDQSDGADGGSPREAGATMTPEQDAVIDCARGAGGDPAGQEDGAMTVDIDRLAELARAATPGPWRWEVNMRTKHMELCGGAKPYDLTVMGFARWGMRGACPEVIMAPPQALEMAHHFAVPVEGREHHSRWFQGVQHPDLNWIETANPATFPALMDRLRAAEADARRFRWLAENRVTHASFVHGLDFIYHTHDIRAAIDDAMRGNGG